ncbi:MAG: hypothetical protein ACTSX7_14075 [Alphaproteobacteria bacterium]
MTAQREKPNDSLASANREIRRLLKRRDKHMHALEAAADSIAEGLEALDQVGRAIRRIRCQHLGPQGASDHLISVSLHGRVQRYLGRKLAHVIGLGFEGKKDGAEPASWATWETTWTAEMELATLNEATNVQERPA